MFLIVVVFDYVRLLDRSITERSIAFDLQNFFVSSIKFDYRTQSSDWVRLGSITERSISYAGSKLIPATCNFKNNAQDCHLHVISLLSLSSVAIEGE